MTGWERSTTCVLAQGPPPTLDVSVRASGVCADRGSGVAGTTVMEPSCEQPLGARACPGCRVCVNRPGSGDSLLGSRLPSASDEGHAVAVRRRRGGVRGADGQGQSRSRMSGLHGWVDLLNAAADEQAAQPERICELCVQVLGISGAGIAMVTEQGHRGVVHATDDVAALIEELQLTLGEGPCIDAVEGGGPVLVPDLTGSPDLAVERWPGFLTEAANAGVQAVFAFPLRIGAISVGALDLYRTSPG